MRSPARPRLRGPRACPSAFIATATRRSGERATRPLALALLVLAPALLACRVGYPTSRTAKRAHTTLQRASEADCATVACREAKTTLTAVGDEFYVETAFPKQPYIARGVVFLAAGDRVELSASIAGDGSLSDLAVTSEQGAIGLRFEQRNDSAGRSAGTSLLYVTNRLDRPLVYCAAMRLPRVGWVPTSSLRVIPQGTGIELWQDPVRALALGDFRLDESGGGCAGLR